MTPEENLIIIKSRSELYLLHRYLEGKSYVAFDTETTGTDIEDKVIGFSVSADVSTGYYVILSYWDVKTGTLKNTDVTINDVKSILNVIKKCDIFMHNAVFDCQMVSRNFQIELMPSVHTDTMILAHLLDENRSNKLKDLAVSIFGEDSTKEQKEMHESVQRNGGVLTKKQYELYKADADLIAKYGAKDTILTLKLAHVLLEQLEEEGLGDFFYEDESMPLLRGPTYDLNTTGFKVDMDRLQKVKHELETECSNLKAFIYKEIEPIVKDKYPGTNKKNTFNIGASQQLAWLLFEKLGQEFHVLTETGRNICEALQIKLPYAPADKVIFIKTCRDYKGHTVEGIKIRDPWAYMSTNKKSLKNYAKKYEWVAKLLEYNKAKKLLSTYVDGLIPKIKYGVLRPKFIQIGTTSGRYSSKHPNFQNLPKKDKRIKSFIVPRPGKIFVGADQSQLEPRVFASVSQDPTLLACFAEGKDFYSVVGAPIFEKTDCSLYKDDKDSFANKYPALRDLSKAFALATPYGTSAFKQSQELDMPKAQCQEIIDKYFAVYPKVELMMLESHQLAMKHGKVYNLFGRPRRIPEAMDIPKIYGTDTPHGELPYAARTLLNLSMNHRVQSSAASIMNRIAIALWRFIKDISQEDTRWAEVKIIIQVHDSLVLEGPIKLEDEMKQCLQHFMENTIKLPGVSLEAKPVSGYKLDEV